mmetsp:Transcript_101403/g.286055  ORF Transcript_101403/g.286055 Transcript_101403/m.286055 type:complete len:231 (-) Transcript_101403:42-734(-)
MGSLLNQIVLRDPLYFSPTASRNAVRSLFLFQPSGTLPTKSVFESRSSRCAAVSFGALPALPTLPTLATALSCFTAAPSRNPFSGSVFFSSFPLSSRFFKSLAAAATAALAAAREAAARSPAEVPLPSAAMARLAALVSVSTALTPMPAALPAPPNDGKRREKAEERPPSARSPSEAAPAKSCPTDTGDSAARPALSTSAAAVATRARFLGRSIYRGSPLRWIARAKGAS